QLSSILTLKGSHAAGTPDAEAPALSDKGSALRPRVASLASLKHAPPQGVLASSNAAAGSSAPIEAAASPAAADRAQDRMPARFKARAVVELLWFDSTFLDTIRKQPDWKEIISYLKPKPRDADFDDNAPPAKRQDAKNRREITGVLAL